jgi:hypothetical protein
MMDPDSGEIEVKMQRYYKSLSQKDHRIWAAIETLKVGYSGQAYIRSLLLWHHET